MAITVTDLGKTYGGSSTPTLIGINLTLAKGRIGSILGSSGAGKSTLLRCLVGLETFDAGFIELDGVRVDPVSGDARKRQREAALAQLRGRVGLVFQSFELFPHLTVLENCTLAPMKIKGTLRADAEKKATELLEKLGVGHRATAYPDHLSGGQKQRVAIARALCMEPAVLLYDEPTSALDPSLRLEVRDTIRKVGEGGVTQLIVTHDIDFAREGSDEVFVLDAGKIVESGASRDVLTKPSHDATKRLLR